MPPIESSLSPAPVQAIYARVQRQVYWFLGATLATIAATSLYLISSNRRLFATLATLSEERRDLAQRLITARESTLRPGSGGDA